VFLQKWQNFAEKPSFHENILQKICHQNQQEVFFNLQNPIFFSSHLWKFHKYLSMNDE